VNDVTYFKCYVTLSEIKGLTFVSLEFIKQVKIPKNEQNRD